MKGEINWAEHKKQIEQSQKRRHYLMRNVPKCPQCPSLQIELVGSNEPVIWKCRQCNHRWTQNVATIKSTNQ